MRYSDFCTTDSCGQHNASHSRPESPQSSLNVQVVHRARTALMVAVLGSVGGLISGCAVVPGMFASYDRQPEVLQTEEEPANVDYTLLEVTPLLVRQMVERADADSVAIQGTLPEPKIPSYPYRLGPQDTLRIFVWGHPDLTPVTSNVTTGSAATTPAGRTIDSQGNIFFPMVGNVRAAGLTVSEFRDRLTRALSKYIPEPQVEVDVAGFRSQRVFLAGELKTPGALGITDQPMRVTDAIAQAGGATNNADLYDAKLTRGDSSVRLNLDRLYYDGDMNVNVLLQAGDVLSIPDRQQRKIFMLGEVGNSVGANQARSYVMRRGRMSLTEVLADAGGVSPFSAASSEIYVMRADPNATTRTQGASNPVVFKLSSREPQMLVLADQFPIMPRDVIFVNPTGPTVIGRFIGQFLPILSTANTANNISPF